MLFESEPGNKRDKGGTSEADVQKIFPRKAFGCLYRGSWGFSNQGDLRDLRTGVNRLQFCGRGSRAAHRGEIRVGKVR